MFLRRKPTARLITGIDLGSTALRVVAGQYKPSGGNGHGSLQIIGASEVPSVGVNRGEVRSIEETVSTVAHALEQIERVIGVPIDRAWVGITGPHVLSEKSRGVVSVAKSDGEISAEDVGRVIEAAKRSAAPLNYEVIHVLPQSYSVDGQIGIRDPVGMTGMKLEVETHIVHGLSSHIQNISRAIYRMGIDIDGLISTAIATGDVATSARQKELGVAVATIGGTTTTLVVLEGGQPIHTAVIPIGADHITNDLALGLRVPVEIAEKVKREYGSAFSKSVGRKDTISLSLVGGPDEAVSRFYTAQIIEARVREILEHIDQSLSGIGRSGMLPAGILFAGGGAKLAGLIDLSRPVLRLPAALGYALETASVTPETNDLSFVPAVGLVRWAARLDEQEPFQSKSSWRRLPGMRDQARRIGRWLLP